MIFIQGIATFLVVFRTISYMDKNAEAALAEQNMKLLSEQVKMPFNLLKGLISL